MAHRPFLQPCSLAGMTLRNRVMMSPMSQNSAGADGAVTDWHFVHYGSRAVGGCGLILMEDTAISEAGRVSSQALSLFNQEHVLAIRPLVAFCQKQGAKVGIQLAHAGRKAYRDKKGHGVDLVSAGTTPFDASWATPQSATSDDIRGIASAFRTAAQCAADANFNMIEIHAAHGYLLHQFLSPLTNNRSDLYGGSAENRTRLLLEVLESVREVWPPDRPIFCRIPAADGHADGLQEDDILELVCILARNGVSAIDVAASNLTPDCTAISTATTHQVGKRIKSIHELAVVVGGMKTAEHLDEMLDGAICDLAAVGRPLLVDPYWAMNAAAYAGELALVPNQYRLAYPS